MSTLSPLVETFGEAVTCVWLGPFPTAYIRPSYVSWECEYAVTDYCFATPASLSEAALHFPHYISGFDFYANKGRSSG